jgi:hypothetical protein
VRSGPGAAKTILLFHIISARPLNSLVWYVPSLRYTRGLGWRIHCGVEVTESSTNKQHISTPADACLSSSRKTSSRSALLKTPVSGAELPRTSSTHSSRKTQTNTSPRRFLTLSNRRLSRRCMCVCFITALQSCSRGGRRRVEDMCYERRRAEACVDESAHHCIRLRKACQHDSRPAAS